MPIIFSRFQIYHSKLFLSSLQKTLLSKLSITSSSENCPGSYLQPYSTQKILSAL